MVVDGTAGEDVTSPFLQPSFAGIWADLDEVDRGRIFSMLPPEDRRAVLDVSKAAFDAEVREEQLSKKAEEGLFWRDVKRATDTLEAERSGANDAWNPVDIGASWDRDQQLPDVGTWSDEQGIFYSGKINEVHGPSESGKTMFLLAVAAQEIRLGHHVIMVDYEDDADAVTARMRWVFGLEREETEKHFHYFNPGRPFTDVAFERLSQLPATFCIIDAVTEAMSISGFDGRNENEVAAWYAEFPKRLATLGMAVALIDHTSKTNHEEALGSQHKKSAITGVSYTAKPVAPFTKGHRGELSIRVAKDKLGGVRPHADSSGDGQAVRGSFVIEGERGDVTVSINGVEAPAPVPVVDPEVYDSLPDVTGIQMRYLKALNFYETRGTSPAGMAAKMKDDGFVTTGPLVRNKLIELNKKQPALAVQPTPKGPWYITPLGVAAIAREAALESSWVGRAAPRRARKSDREQDETLGVSPGVLDQETKPLNETSETSAKPLAKPSLTCDETSGPKNET